ncbi:PREDICTED: uncharacterized protein LOC109582734 [Amphimedon queenslandica]|uniref:CUB domain-containing protein n=1 Tax=Amphimedon queenslandica TaxID=400682 RepID=A0A1X7UMX9_AMPQE|nr:PREDICTED: uncharacterized protein LOC109582734 [Amphimedon queenslandica]|eukprot:XP_019853202.1 PREDICTED: uncharacterized protein LOC109582734 [Amphimedon queenslandica]
MISTSAICLSFASLAVLFAACTSGQTVPCRPQCCEWMNQDYGLSLQSPTPRGFITTTLPNPEDMLSNPCINVTAQETDQYIEILVETTTPGRNSRVCVTVNDDPNPTCGNGQVSYCQQVPSLNMTITIFCDDSCDQSEILFWFRVNVSQAVSFDDVFWCSRRLGDYPSGLINVTTPPNTNPTEIPTTNPTELPITHPTDPPVTNPTEGTPPVTNPTEGTPPVTNPTEGTPPVTNPTEGPPPVTNPHEGPPSNSSDSTNAPQPTSSPEPTSAGTTPSSNLLLMLCIIALTQIYNNF